jgi:ubiquinone biosynthesis monooxygenase Coq7
MSDKADDMQTQRAGAATSAHRLDEILRVDHAGELGAVRIYQGQLAVLNAAPASTRPASLVRHMLEQEKVHKANFDKLLAERKVRPTLLDPLWSMAGFALGAATALMGEKAAMACTVAVEDVIGEHYAKQIDELSAKEPALASELGRMRNEELEHRATGLSEGAERTPGYALLSGLIKAGCRLAIKVAEKV